MKEDGGQAFPAPAWKRRFPTPGTPPLHVDAVPGMSLRDYFAAKAMQGLLAQSVGTALSSSVGDGAKYAYEMADAMLEERKG